jgi:hypothetical protein
MGVGEARARQQVAESVLSKPHRGQQPARGREWMYEEQLRSAEVLDVLDLRVPVNHGDEPIAIVWAQTCPARVNPVFGEREAWLAPGAEVAEGRHVLAVFRPLENARVDTGGDQGGVDPALAEPVEDLVVAPHCDGDGGLGARLGVEPREAVLGLQGTGAEALKRDDANADGRRRGGLLGWVGSPGAPAQQEGEHDGVSRGGKDRCRGHPHGVSIGSRRGELTRYPSHFGAPAAAESRAKRPFQYRWVFAQGSGLSRAGGCAVSCLVVSSLALRRTA